MNPNRLAGKSLAILFAVNILNFYDRHVPGALTEPIRKEFGLTDTQVGLLGTAFTLIYAVMGVPLGRLADSISRKKLLAAGMVVWGALTAYSGLATSYALLLFSRLGCGVGEATCAPTATSWIGDLFPAAKRARPLAVFMLGVPIGGGLSYMFSGSLAQAYGWRPAMILAALPVLFLAPALLRLDEPRRGAAEIGGPHPLETHIGSVLRIPTLWWIVASGALVNFNLYALATFLPAFLARVHGFSLRASGVATGIGFGVCGVLGGLIAGSLGDRIVHRRKEGRMLLASGAALVAAPIAFFGILLPAGSGVLAVTLITISYGALNMYYGPVYSSIHDIVAPALRGTTMAIYFMAMYLCGASFGPLLTGNLSDRMAHRAASAAGSPAITEAYKAIGLHQAMFVIPLLSVGLALVLYGGSRTIARDMARRETSMSQATPATGNI